MKCGTGAFYERFRGSVICREGRLGGRHTVPVLFTFLDLCVSKFSIGYLILRPLACWHCRFESCTDAWVPVSFECCVLSGRGLCVGLITRPEESNRVWCV